METEETVTFTISWKEPSDRNGPFHYLLEYEAAQNDPYPESRQMSVNFTTRELFDEDLIPVGGRVEFVFSEALPYANYIITVTPVNTKLNRSGPSRNVSGRTNAIGMPHEDHTL